MLASEKTGAPTNNTIANTENLKRQAIQAKGRHNGERARTENSRDCAGYAMYTYRTYIQNTPTSTYTMGEAGRTLTVTIEPRFCLSSTGKVPRRIYHTGGNVSNTLHDPPSPAFLVLSAFGECCAGGEDFKRHRVGIWTARSGMENTTVIPAVGME